MRWFLLLTLIGCSKRLHQGGHSQHHTQHHTQQQLNPSIVQPTLLQQTASAVRKGEDTVHHIARPQHTTDVEPGVGDSAILVEVGAPSTPSPTPSPSSSSPTRSSSPTLSPSTLSPTLTPSPTLSSSLTPSPTISPSVTPTSAVSPSAAPTLSPTTIASSAPSATPTTSLLTPAPVVAPSVAPTLAPGVTSVAPSVAPSAPTSSPVSWAPTPITLSPTNDPVILDLARRMSALENNPLHLVSQSTLPEESSGVYFNVSTLLSFSGVDSIIVQGALQKMALQIIAVAQSTGVVLQYYQILISMPPAPVAVPPAHQLVIARVDILLLSRRQANALVLALDAALKQPAPWQMSSFLTTLVVMEPQLTGAFLQADPATSHADTTDLKTRLWTLEHPSARIEQDLLGVSWFGDTIVGPGIPTIGPTPPSITPSGPPTPKPVTLAPTAHNPLDGHFVVHLPVPIVVPTD